MNPKARFDHYRGRIAAHDGRIGAFLALRLEEAESEAADSAARYDKGEALSPIDGWCIAVKANIAVAGMPHHAGIEAYKDDVAERDAEIIGRLRAAGAVILGLVNMDEGALGAVTDNPFFGRTQNPWREGVTPGGSSGGSATAVAAGFCDAALGSDTMGSVRIPSAYCGVQGIKPSRGLLPAGGVLPLSATLDHIGPHARRVSGLGRLLFIMSGRAGMAAEPTPLAGLRIGVWRASGEVDIEDDVAAGFERAVAALGASGAQISAVEPPLYAYGRSRRAGLLVAEAEAAELHEAKLRKDPLGFSEAFRAMLAWGAAQGTEKIAGARSHLEDLERAAPALFEKADIVISPTAPQTAFRFGQEVPVNQADLTAYANFAGLPAAAVFTGMNENGLPLSLQVIGPHGGDAQVLAAAVALEALFGAPPSPML